jgi:hypothetical protein
MQIASAEITNSISFKKQDSIFFIIFGVIFLLLFYSFFFQSNTFYDRDTTLLEIPLRMHTAELLKQGNWALWTDAHGNGQPFLANPKMAVFYPTTWLYLIFPFFVAFKIHYFIHPLIGWLGLYLLAKTYGLSKKAAFLASTIFHLSGIYLSSFEFYNHIAAMAWMMWALFLHRLDPPIRSFKFILSIFVWVLLILSGAPEFIVITGLLAFGQCFFDSVNFRKSFSKLLLTFFLACLLSAIQLLPSFELLTQTSRAQQAEIWPLELIQLLNLVFPGILGDDRQPGHNDFWGGHLFDRWYPLYYSFYAGFATSILFILCLFELKNRKEKIVAIEALVFFLISCGKYSPFFFIYRHLPLLSSIRYPVKFFVGAFFCFSLLAAFGLEKFSLNSVRRFLVRVLFIVSLIIMTIFILFKQPILTIFYRLFVIDKDSSKEQLFNSILTGLIILILSSTFLLFISQWERARKILIPVFLIFCISDPFYHNRYINPTVPESFFQKPSILEEINLPATIYREEELPFTLALSNMNKIHIMAYFWQSLYPFSGLAVGIKYILNRDFMSTYPSYQKELRDKIKSLPQDKKLTLLKYIGCRYYFSNKPLFFPETAKKFLIHGFPLCIEEISREPAQPFLVFKFIRARTIEEKMAILTHPHFNPMNIAIVDNKISLPEEIEALNHLNLPSSEQPASSVGTIRIIKEFSGYGHYIIELKRPGIVLFPGNWQKGWKAFVNGKKTLIFEGNLYSKGIYLSEGQHEVILRYIPDGFIYGRWVSLLSLIILITFYPISKKFLTSIQISISA